MNPSIPKQQSKNKKVIIIVLSLIVGVLVIGAVWLSALYLTGSYNKKVVMVVGYDGGLCSNGQVCSSRYNLYEDGTFVEHASATGEEMIQLTEVLNNTDFLKYDSDPSPMCQSFIDGSDMSLQFPGRYSDETFTLCLLDIEPTDESINYIYDFIGSHPRNQL